MRTSWAPVTPLSRRSLLTRLTGLRTRYDAAYVAQRFHAVALIMILLGKTQPVGDALEDDVREAGAGVARSRVDVRVSAEREDRLVRDSEVTTVCCVHRPESKQESRHKKSTLEWNMVCHLRA